jgi:hypothetical protein
VEDIFDWEDDDLRFDLEIKRIKLIENKPQLRAIVDLGYLGISYFRLRLLEYKGRRFVLLPAEVQYSGSEIRQQRRQIAKELLKKLLPFVVELYEIEIERRTKSK